MTTSTDSLDAALPAADKLAGESDPSKALSEADKEKIKKADKLREVLAATYVFVRSQEVNRTIGSFTFDHYADEAKRRIKGDGRAVTDALGEAFDTRPSQLDALTKLETDFTNSFDDLKKLADAAGQ